MPAKSCFTIGAGPFAAMGRSYKSPGHRVGAGHAREALFHHRCGPIRGHGPFLQKPGHRRGSGPFLQKARAPPQERAMPAKRCFTIGAGPFAAMGRSYQSPGTA